MSQALSRETNRLYELGQPFLAVSSVKKIFNEGTRHALEAVSDVSFDVPSGQFLSILGPSGCGKSTLLMMAGGLERPTLGTVRINGTPVTGPRRTTGIMFQDPTLLPWKTVLENVLFPIRIQKLSLKDYKQRARDLLAMVGLADFAAKKPHQLSGGMKQRAAICRALITDPDLLLMDEPFSALDALTRDELNGALLDIWQRTQKTGVFITHSIREAVFLSDRVIVMDRRPSRIVDDLIIPFQRPRTMAVQDSKEFVEICAHLRGKIAHA